MTMMLRSCAARLPLQRHRSNFGARPRPAAAVSAPAPAPTRSGSSCRSGGPDRRRAAAAAAFTIDAPLSSEEPPELSFYELLGVSPSADARQIKKAYHALMREVHPDTLAAASGSDDAFYASTTDLAALLNEVYQTLSDPEQRATYDALAGFDAAAGFDPFSPGGLSAFERDQVFVDEVSCIGCGKCVRACPAAFVIEGSKYGRARVARQPVGPDEQEDVQIAMETCPVDVIHWVTLPQLSLLEAALGRMARVDAFVMMRRGGAAGDVFHEAAKAWRRRQSQARARAQAAASAASAAANGFGVGGGGGGLWGAFNQHVDWAASGNGGSGGSSSDSGDGDGSGSGGASSSPRAAGRIADLAARAAQSARLWRMQSASKAPQRALSE